jgi:hypothetical protein
MTILSDHKEMLLLITPSTSGCGVFYFGECSVWRLNGGEFFGGGQIVKNIGIDSDK